MRLEVVIPVRDKDVDLLENSLVSVNKAQDGPYTVHLVDLGSQEPRQYSDMSVEYGLDFTTLEYHEWNKPLALNFALKRSSADWFGMLDGDYLVEKEFFVKIISEFEKGTFIQCRGYEMGEQFSSQSELGDHFSFANAITEHNMSPRPMTDYGGFQAIPVKTAREIGGYDESFRLYGGMHHEMRNRLINKGLKEKRLHGDPLLLHQTHESWVDESKHSGEEIEKERDRHREIISQLEEGSRYQSNEGKIWGEVV